MMSFFLHTEPASAQRYYTTFMESFFGKENLSAHTSAVYAHIIQHTAENPLDKKTLAAVHQAGVLCVDAALQSFNLALPSESADNAVDHDMLLSVSRHAVTQGAPLLKGTYKLPVITEQPQKALFSVERCFGDASAQIDSMRHHQENFGRALGKASNVTHFNNTMHDFNDYTILLLRNCAYQILKGEPISPPSTVKNHGFSDYLDARIRNRSSFHFAY